MVVDKQGEIAILQTQGLTKPQVMQIFIFQGSIVGIIGSILGVILGVVAAMNLDTLISMINPAIVLPTLISPTQITVIAVVSILLSLACTLYPAFRASKIEPAQALRYE